MNQEAFFVFLVRVKQVPHEPIFKKIHQLESQSGRVARMLLPDTRKRLIELPMLGDMFRCAFVTELLKITLLRGEMYALISDDRVEKFRYALRIRNTMDDVDEVIDHTKHLLMLLIDQAYTDAVAFLPFKNHALGYHTVAYRYLPFHYTPRVNSGSGSLFMNRVWIISRYTLY